MSNWSKEYRMTYDYHTHTIFSHGWIRPHGKGTVRQNIEAAHRAGLKEYAISDHGPGHIFYGIKRDQLSKQRKEIDEVAANFPDMKVWMSVESNIKGTKNGLDLTESDKEKFDFILAGYHFGVTKGCCIGNWLYSKGLASWLKKSLTIKNTANYLRALENNKIKILTHPGDKGPVDMDAIARACEAQGTLMEISTWHTHLTVKEIEIAAKYDVKFIISSDAHTPDRIGSFEKGLDRAYEAGLDFNRIVNIERR